MDWNERLYDEMCFFDGGGRNILRGGKWGARGREAGGEGEGSGGLDAPLSTPTYLSAGECDVENTRDQNRNFRYSYTFGMLL